MMTTAIRLPKNREAMTTSLLMLLAAVAWAWLALTVGPNPSLNPICGLHTAAPHEHCWRCYALAATALGLTLGALNRLARLALSQNNGE